MLHQEPPDFEFINKWPITRMFASIAWAIAFSIGAIKCGPTVVQAGKDFAALVIELHRDCILPGTIPETGKKRGPG